MNAPDTTAPPLPAPLPYSSAAGRGEIPAPPSAPPVEDADFRPRMAEDEFSLWLCFGVTGVLIVMMAIVAAMGGL